jgi:hypothetical protein
MERWRNREGTKWGRIRKIGRECERQDMGRTKAGGNKRKVKRA